MTIEKLVQQEFDFVKQVDKDYRRKELKELGVAGLYAIPAVAVMIGAAYSLAVVLEKYS